MKANTENKAWVGELEGRSKIIQAKGGQLQDSR